LVTLAIFPPADWLVRSANLNGLIALSDVFWSVEMIIKYNHHHHHALLKSHNKCMKHIYKQQVQMTNTKKKDTS